MKQAAVIPFRRAPQDSMPTPRGQLRLLLFALCFGVAQPFAATAQLNVPVPLPPAAEEAFDKGILAAREQGYLVAIRYLQDARKLAPQAPQIFRSLGAVEAKIPGRELRAIAWYGAYLGAMPNAPDAADVKNEIIRLDVKAQINISGLIRQVQDSASQISHATDRDDSLKDVAELWAQAGDISAALKSVDLIGRAPNFAAEGSKDWALKSIAGVQAYNGDIAGANKTAESIRYAHTKCETQQNIARAQLKAGDASGAQITLAAAGKTAYQTNPGRDRFHLLTATARLQAEAGDITGAQQIMEPLVDPVEKWVKELGVESSWIDGVVVAIVEAQVKAGDIASAFKTVDRIKSDSYRESAWRSIAVAQLAGGDILGAQKTVNLLPEGLDKSRAQESVAKAQTKAGDIAGALKTAGMIRDASSKKRTLEAIVSAQIRALDFAGALRSTDLMAEGDKVSSQYAIVGALSDAGNIAGALKVVDAIQQALWKTFAEVRISKAQIKNGDLTGAKLTLAAAQRTADKIEGAKDKASGQNSIAQAKAVFADTTNSTPQSIPANPSSMRPPVAITAWTEKLDDSNLGRDCPLNTGPFLDLAGYLKSLPPSDSPKKVFESLHKTARTLVTAQSVITGMLKQQTMK